MAPTEVTRRYLVSGRVQGVGFRYFVHRHAASLGLLGSVRNLPDGRVEAVARGPEGALMELERLLRTGPPHSQVQNVEKSDISDEVTVSNIFEIK